MKNKIHHLGILSFAKFQALLGFYIGIVLGVIYAFGGLIIDLLVTGGLLSATVMSTTGLSWGTLLAFGALIGMPIIFAVLGLILGIVEAFLFNFFANRFGGIHVDMQ
jgi:hypothetical protein